MSVSTVTGRKIPNPPKIRGESNRKAINDLRAQNRWLLEQAIDEAKSRSDDYNLLWMKGEDPKRLPPAVKDSLNQYLFGDANPEL